MCVLLCSLVCFIFCQINEKFFDFLTVTSSSSCGWFAGDRQMRIYGTRDNNNNNSDGTVSSASSTGGATAAYYNSGLQTTTTIASSTSKGGGSIFVSSHSGGGGGSSSSNTPHQSTTTTPQNTPAASRGGGANAVGSGASHDESNTGGGGGVLLCPRGLAAIPLLCAAASESRSAYLARLQVTHPSNGVSRMRERERLYLEKCSAIFLLYYSISNSSKRMVSYYYLPKHLTHPN